jgi:GMP synthase (glutamine-hydrolysing)
VSFGQPGQRSIAIRPFITNDFMTGRPAVPGQDMPEAALSEMIDGILGDQELGVARVVLDLTSKPPGTTEWE